MGALCVWRGRGARRGGATSPRARWQRRARSQLWWGWEGDEQVLTSRRLWKEEMEERA